MPGHPNRSQMLFTTIVPTVLQQSYAWLKNMSQGNPLLQGDHKAARLTKVMLIIQFGSYTKAPSRRITFQATCSARKSDLGSSVRGGIHAGHIRVALLAGFARNSSKIIVHRLIIQR